MHTKHHKPASLTLSSPSTSLSTLMCSYEVRTGHRIVIAFDAARVDGVQISEGLEAFIAPALLPRTPLQHQLLLAIKQVGGACAGGTYDRHVLVGRF